MDRNWITPVLFGVGTFCILMSALDAVGVIEVSRNPSALGMVGIGLCMLGAARLRSRSSKLRRKP